MKHGNKHYHIAKDLAQVFDYKRKFAGSPEVVILVEDEVFVGCDEAGLLGEGIGQTHPEIRLTERTGTGWAIPDDLKWEDYSAEFETRTNSIPVVDAMTDEQVLRIRALTGSNFVPVLQGVIV